MAPLGLSGVQNVASTILQDVAGGLSCCHDKTVAWEKEENGKGSQLRKDRQPSIQRVNT